MSIIKIFDDINHSLQPYKKLHLLSKQLAMPTKLTPEIGEVIKAIHFLPSVSVIMPFEPKMIVTLVR